MLTSLFFEEYGSEQSKSILFLHGGGASGWSWRPIAEKLSDKYHCVIPDLPQHGKSQHIEPFNISFAVESLMEVVDSLGTTDHWTMVGLSEGAQIGVEILAKFPEKFKFSILSGALIFPLPGTKWLTRNLLGWSYDWFVKPFQKSDWYIRLNMSASVGIPNLYFQQFKNDFQLLSKSAWINLMEANLTYRMPVDLRKAKTNTLFLSGDKEYQVMKESTIHLAETARHATAGFVKIPGRVSLAQSHNWPLNAPDLAADIIHNWINQNYLPSVVTIVN